MSSARLNSIISDGCLCDRVFRVQADHCDQSLASLCEVWQKIRNCAGPVYRYRGRELDRETAVKTASNILAKAKYPLIVGLDNIGTRSQQQCCHLARLCGGVIAVNFGSDGGWSAAIAREGMTTATLGEIESRADLIWLIGREPKHAHPRLFQKLSQGKMRPKIFHWSNGFHSSTPQGARTIAMAENELEKCLITIESLIGGTPFETESSWKTSVIFNSEQPDVVPNRVGSVLPPDPAFDELLAAIEQAQYVAIAVFGLGNSENYTSALDTLISLAKKLNQVVRTVILPVEPWGNRLGAQEVLSWTTGFPDGVDWLSGQPVCFGDTRANRVLRRKECDAALVFGPSDPQYSRELEHLLGIPLIWFKQSSAQSDQCFVKYREVLEISGLNPFPDTFVRVDGLPFEIASPIGRDDSEGMHGFLNEMRLFFDSNTSIVCSQSGKRAISKVSS
jgi:formylmethanofuran dehydrogenase subunit B